MPLFESPDYSRIDLELALSQVEASCKVLEKGPESLEIGQWVVSHLVACLDRAVYLYDTEYGPDSGQRCDASFWGMLQDEIGEARGFIMGINAAARIDSGHFDRTTQLWLKMGQEVQLSLKEIKRLASRVNAL